VAEE
jgi:hypothetical protein